VFDGFAQVTVTPGSLPLFVRHASPAPGAPAVLMLHGHPRTSATWHRVAPRLLAAGLAVVCPDLPGYGRSGKPEPAPDHRPHAKRTVARHLAALMDHLGHERFAVVGHDRGGLSALRLALDHPDRVTRAVLADCLPVSEHLARITPEFAEQYWHWFFFAQPERPERVITADPDAWYGGSPAAMGEENFAERRAAIHDPDVVRGMLEDYRAGLTADRDDELADRAAGRRIRCPLLVLWSTRDDLEDLYGDPAAIWRDWADDVRGHGIDSGHHVAEEAPEGLARSLLEFLSPRGPAARPRSED
jgi:haloacetate dehalogenase